MIFGTASLGSRYSEKESLKILAHAYEAGFRHFDTAPSYGDGRSEEILSKFLQSYNVSEGISITSKYGILHPSNGYVYNLSKRVYQFSRKYFSYLDYFAKRFRPALLNADKAEHDKILDHLSEFIERFDGNTVSFALHDISKDEIKTMDVEGLLSKFKALFPHVPIGYSATQEDVHKAVGQYFDFANIHWNCALANATVLPKELRMFGGSSELSRVRDCATKLDNDHQKTVDIIVFSSNPRRISKFLES